MGSSFWISEQRYILYMYMCTCTCEVLGQSGCEVLGVMCEVLGVMCEVLSVMCEVLSDV